MTGYPAAVWLPLHSFCAHVVKSSQVCQEKTAEEKFIQTLVRIYVVLVITQELFRPSLNGRFGPLCKNGFASGFCVNWFTLGQAV